MKEAPNSMKFMLLGASSLKNQLPVIGFPPKLFCSEGRRCSIFLCHCYSLSKKGWRYQDAK